MLRPVLTLAALIPLAGCATSPGQTDSLQADAGGDNVTINCSGPDSDWVLCYRHANQVCGLGGFTVVRRDGVIGPPTPGNDARTMIVSCK